MLKRLAPRTRPYRSVFGEFQLERFVYGQREGQAIERIPLDARLKLPETCTSFLLQSWNEQLLIDQPYAQTNDLLERVLEVRQSVQTLERQQAGLSTSVDAFWAQQPVPAFANTLVVNTVDGKGVAMRASETQGLGGKKKMALLGRLHPIATGFDCADQRFRRALPSHGRGRWFNPSAAQNAQCASTWI